ncbi:MAG: YgjV family protein [Treponema sp.]|nr:YgjV family protein [Treponema sp.]
MNAILLGNIISFIGATIMVAIGLIKTKKKILIAQCFQFAIMGIGNLILGGVTGFVANAVSIARNLLSCKFDLNLPLRLFFIALQIGITAFVNDAGIIGWLPVIAACIFTWCLNTKNEVILKLLIILAQAMWCVYDFSIKNYASLTFDVLTIVTNLVGIVLIKLKPTKEPSTPQENQS